MKIISRAIFILILFTCFTYAHLEDTKEQLVASGNEDLSKQDQPISSKSKPPRANVMSNAGDSTLPTEEKDNTDAPEPDEKIPTEKLSSSIFGPKDSPNESNIPSASKTSAVKPSLAEGSSGIANLNLKDNTDTSKISDSQNTPALDNPTSKLEVPTKVDKTLKKKLDRKKEHTSEAERVDPNAKIDEKSIGIGNHTGKMAEYTNTHLLAFFFTVIAMAVLCHFLFHIKQRIIALVQCCCHQGRGGGGVTKYKKIDNLEEVMSSTQGQSCLEKID